MLNCLADSASACLFVGLSLRHCLLRGLRRIRRMFGSVLRFRTRLLRQLLDLPGKHIDVFFLRGLIRRGALRFPQVAEQLLRRFSQ
jgi:hypothetical protein